MYSSQEAKPFLKWAGGKRQLLPQLKKYFPKELCEKGKIKNFHEPFLGSGAVFFWVAQHCNIEKSFLNEINPEIYLCYITIKKDVDLLIEELKALDSQYKSSDAAERKDLFYKIRTEYNTTRKPSIFKRYIPAIAARRAAMTIFLNRTCFNGLYRVNSNGDFNTPHGRYPSPRICDAQNLLKVSKLLENVEISNKDFASIRTTVKKDSFVYFDPPYKPVSATASFTAYTSPDFGDKDQARLARLVRTLDKRFKAKIMLSNSSPDSDFFEKLYSGFHIEKIVASRFINCDASKRGKVAEILVMNYQN